MKIFCLESGFVQSYIDFFYITHQTMPPIVEVVDNYNEDDFEEEEEEGKEKEKREVKTFEMTEATLLDLKKTLMNAEENTRQKPLRNK